jgi:ribosomal-protein-alanine N-acetyltransferase
MRPADVAAVVRIERAAFAREAWPASAFAYLVAVFGARPPRGRLWVAATGKREIVGYVGVELSALGGEADVVNLAVDRAHRRAGVGRRLLATALRYCRRRGIALVWLRVRAGNRGARAFYRSCGFRPVGRFRGYYTAPREDAVLMARLPR